MKPRFLLCIIALSFNLQTRAQCCSAGNPSSGGGTSGMSKNSFAVSSTFIHSYSDTYLEGSSPSDYVYLNNSNFDFGLLAFNYGLTDKISLSTELGYFLDKSIEFNKDLFVSEFINPKRTARGLGDAAIGLQYHLDSYKEKLINISTSLKVSIPIGQFDQMDGNIILPIDIQPSSGSYKVKSSFMIHKGFFGSKFSLSTYWSSEFSQRINTERTDYKYGNLYNLGFKVSHRTSKKINTGIYLLLVHREKAGNNSVVMHSTGGSFVNLQPSASFQLKNNYSINSSIVFPIYRNINGIQLVNKYVFAVGLSKGFHLKTIKAQIDYTILETLNETTVFVDGICGMCKERIETIAYKLKGVKWAEWDLESKILTLKFKEGLNEEKLAETLAKGGHDNWMLKAYQSLHSWCKYRS